MNKKTIVLALILSFVLLGGCTSNNTVGSNDVTTLPTAPAATESSDPVADLEEDLGQMDVTEDFPTYEDQDLGL